MPTQLRKDFIAHLQLRGYAENTVRNYIESMVMYTRYFNKSPLELNHSHVKKFL